MELLVAPLYHLDENSVLGARGELRGGDVEESEGISRSTTQKFLANTLVRASTFLQEFQGLVREVFGGFRGYQGRSRTLLVGSREV